MLQAAVNSQSVQIFHDLGQAAQDFVARSQLVASNYCYCSNCYY